MKHWMSLGIALFFLPSVWAGYSENVLEEVLYQDFKQSVLSEDGQKINSRSGLTSFEQKLFVDAIWDMADEGDPEAIKALDSITTFHYDLIEKLRVGILRIRYKRAIALPEDLTSELASALVNPVVETKLIYVLAAYEEDILNAGHADIIELAKNHKEYFYISEDESRKKEITKDIVADIFHNGPDVTTYMNGEYAKSVKIFMFCRENRLYPCLMVMKNVHGEPVRNADGSLWSHPSLASSARGHPSYARNGNTPAGILTIDSVMPVADQQISFGKFRRMMLNFVPKSKDEVLMKSLLPESSHKKNWWRTSVTAREIGRSLLRIHGTGKINKDEKSPYYPFVRTSGCIAQRENTYDGLTYRDQRELLDDVMKAMDMMPVYANELKVKGILYLVEIDDLNSAVEASDLALRGIE